MLVVGTCIGGGMLALPVATGILGFFPSIILVLIGWAYMTTTALLLAEANLWMEKGAHVITLASRLLGPIGKAIAWVLYLFIGYASLVAYSAGGSELFAVGIEKFFGIIIPNMWAVIIFVFIFGVIVYLGNVIVGRVNTFLVVGLAASYLLLIGSGASYVQWHYLIGSSWEGALMAMPLLLTIFSFQTIIPSLTIYLQQDGRALRFSIVLGTTLALIIYVIWQWLVLGTVLLDGEYGLAAALAMGKPVTELINLSIKSVWLGTIADFFAFFALVTSFLGIALGLFDFLADGLEIKKEKWGSIAIGLLIVVPTLFFVLSMERVFLRALDASGGIGDSILNGVFPALMVWMGRYHKQMTSSYRVPGGKPLLLFIICYGLFVFIVELLGKFGLITSLSSF